MDVVDPCNSTAHKKKLDKDGKCTKDYTEIDKWLNGKYLRKFVGNYKANLNKLDGKTVEFVSEFDSVFTLDREHIYLV